MSAPSRVPSFGSSLMNLGNQSNNFSIGSGLAFLGDSLRGTLSVGSNLGMLASQSIGNLAALATSSNAAVSSAMPARQRNSSVGSNLCGFGAVVRNASLGSLCDIEQLGDDWPKNANPLGSPNWQSPKESSLSRLPSCNLFRVDSVVFSPNRTKLLDERDQKDKEWQSRLAKLSEGKTALSPQHLVEDPEPTPPSVLAPAMLGNKADQMDDVRQVVLPPNSTTQEDPLAQDHSIDEPSLHEPADLKSAQQHCKISDSDERASSVSVETPAFKSKPTTKKDLKGSTSAMSRKMTDEEHSVMLYKRKLRNRQSAARSRKRHQAILQSLQDDLNELAMRADKAVASCETSSSQNAKLRESNMRLYCENAYLRAQLSMVSQDGSSRPLPPMSLNGV